MIIQCPQCRARYRIKDQVAAPGSATATCPKCQERFVAQDHQVPDDRQQQGKTILVVDDAKFFRELIFDILGDMGYRLSAAENAKSAWQLLTQQGADLLIVDVNLPDLNGYDFIKKVRQLPKFRDIPILCISGVFRQTDDLAKALNAGANDFSTKSFNPEELQNRVRALIEDELS